MASWKFTDQYGTDFPALANSILGILEFDISGSSPVSGTTFTGTLDLKASGNALNVLALLLGMESIPMTGSVTSDSGELKVDLTSTNDSDIKAALAAIIPLIGGSILQAGSVAITNQTSATADAEDDSEVDEFDLNTTIQIGGGTGELVTQIPMSDGVFSLNGTFTGLGIGLSDLDFLVPGSQFSSQFPTDLPSDYYNPSTTQLELLELDLSLQVSTKSGIDLSIVEVATNIGIVNIPLYPNALFLNPLAVNISVTSPTQDPQPQFGLTGTIALYPAGKQTSPPSVDPDFTYDLEAQLPTGEDATFIVSGTWDNPENLGVQTVINDLMNQAYDTGIGEDVTLENFDFEASADTEKGEISGFSVEIVMSSTFGIFGNSGFDVKDFSISLDYEK